MYYLVEGDGYLTFLRQLRDGIEVIAQVTFTTNQNESLVRALITYHSQPLKHIIILSYYHITILDKRKVKYMVGWLPYMDKIDKTHGIGIYIYKIVPVLCSIEGKPCVTML